jgi:hypothetical protein
MIGSATSIGPFGGGGRGGGVRIELSYPIPLYNKVLPLVYASTSSHLVMVNRRLGSLMWYRLQG